MKLPTIKQLEKLFDAEVRPYLASHDGNVEIVSFEDGVLRIRMLGRCSGCPSAQLTNEEVISETVRNAYPAVKSVILVTDVSDELIDMAKKILGHKL